MEELAVGQSVVRIFTLVAFPKDRHITLRIKHGVKIVTRYPRGFTGALMRRVLPWGDLLMMRRQLLNFRNLAEGKA